MSDVRDLICDIIIKSGYKRCAIAEKAGMTSSKLSGVLSKRRKLEANELFALCHALNVTPDDLFRPSA